jgi:hypothetical protein
MVRDNPEGSIPCSGEVEFRNLAEIRAAFNSSWSGLDQHITSHFIVLSQHRFRRCLRQISIIPVKMGALISLPRTQGNSNVFLGNLVGKRATKISADDLPRMQIWDEGWDWLLLTLVELRLDAVGIMDERMQGLTNIITGLSYPRPEGAE